MHTERMAHAVDLLTEVETRNLPFDMTYWFDDPEFTHDCDTAAKRGRLDDEG